MSKSKYQPQLHSRGKTMKFLSLTWTYLSKWEACKAAAWWKGLSSDNFFFLLLTCYFLLIYFTCFTSCSQCLLGGFFLFLNIEYKILLPVTVDVSVLPQDCKFYLDADIMFLNMGSLVEYYSTHVLPSHGSLILRCPYGYSKPRWQGQHNSLTLRKNGFSAVLELNVDFCHCWISHCLHTEPEFISTICSHVNCAST